MRDMDYKITDTRQVDRMTQAGTQVQMYRVWLVTARGATGTLDVPTDKWNKEDLPSLLEAKVADLDLAFDLTE